MKVIFLGCGYLGHNLSRLLSDEFEISVLSIPSPYTAITEGFAEVNVFDPEELKQIIWLFLSSVFNLAVTAASATWTLNEHIPYRIVAVIVAGALTAIVFALIAGAIYGTTIYIAYRICKFYKKYFWDLPSLVEALISMGILVWFADKLSGIKWNLVAVWLLIHLLYMIVRSVFAPPKKSYY